MAAVLHAGVQPQRDRRSGRRPTAVGRRRVWVRALRYLPMTAGRALVRDRPGALGQTTPTSGVPKPGSTGTRP